MLEVLCQQFTDVCDSVRVFAIKVIQEELDRSERFLQATTKYRLVVSDTISALVQMLKLARYIRTFQALIRK